MRSRAPGTPGRRDRPRGARGRDRRARRAPGQRAHRDRARRVRRRPFTRGTILLDGKPVTVGSAREAVRLGLALVTEDRKAEGLALEQSISANARLVLDAVTPGTSDRRAKAIPGILSSLDLVSRSKDAEVQYLSGGNQQKVVLAKWLVTDPSVMVLDEPTRGIDVGAKRAVYDLMRALTARGVAILLISSELPEVVAMADRILVMRDGRLAGELHAGSDEETIMAMATGAGRPLSTSRSISPPSTYPWAPQPALPSPRCPAASPPRPDPRSETPPRRTNEHRGEHRLALDGERQVHVRPAPAPLGSTGIVYLALAGILVVSAGLVAAQGGSFFSQGNLFYLLSQTSLLGFVAIGQTFVILCKSLDLSVGYVVAWSSLVAATTMAGDPSRIWLGVVAALAVAAASGSSTAW
ncbi:ATP-binding cassette domain-containing protein [Oerskovia sp. M15]